ncbi:MAG: DUF2283 domain-containing protein [Chloroflexota bacterium]|nr:DUF2283 domain-containing protein [Chloroflexota bacterium]
MERQLKIQYDRVGHILYLGNTRPYPEQETEEVAYGVVARLNPQSGAIENLEVLFFSARLENGRMLPLPVLAQFDWPTPHAAVNSPREKAFA